MFLCFYVIILQITKKFTAGIGNCSDQTDQRRGYRKAKRVDNLILSFMKKVLLLFGMLLAANVGVAKDGDVETYQAIITDCGTVYQIPAECSVDQACWFLDHYTKIDCGGIGGSEEAVIIEDAPQHIVD